MAMQYLSELPMFFMNTIMISHETTQTRNYGTYGLLLIIKWIATVLSLWSQCCQNPFLIISGQVIMQWLNWSIQLLLVSLCSNEGLQIVNPWLQCHDLIATFSTIPETLFYRNLWLLCLHWHPVAGVDLCNWEHGQKGYYSVKANLNMVV